MPTIEAPKQVFTFQVLAGEHIGNKRSYKKGECFQSQYPLDEMFVGKFQRMPSQPLPPDDLPEQTLARGQVVQNSQPNQNMAFSFAAATNVTNVFPLAKKVKFEVFKDEMGGFAVTEATAQIKTNLADQVLTSKKEVNAFISRFLPAEGENNGD